MAGDWIPVRTGLAQEPEVVRIVSAICPQSVHDLSARVRTTSAVIGALVQTWSLFDALTDDGVLHGYTAEWLNAQVGMEGFAENLQHVGWLVLNEQSLEMPGFTTWLGHSAKRRLKDAQRKREERKTASTKRPQDVRNAADKKRTTGQDRTEEKNTVLPNGNTCADLPADTGGSGLIFASRSGPWELPSRKLAEYEATYQVDVRQELAKAAQWCRDNPQRRKSKQGMAKFLTAWLNRQSDDHQPRGSPGRGNSRAFNPLDYLDEDPPNGQAGGK